MKTETVLLIGMGVVVVFLLMRQQQQVVVVREQANDPIGGVLGNLANVFSGL